MSSEFIIVHIKTDAEKKETKHSSVLLLHLVSSLHQSLVTFSYYHEIHSLPFDMHLVFDIL